jgi:MOSC domain-containing protein YiiM
MTPMHVVSINIGTPQPLVYGSKRTYTAGLKTPVPQAMLRFHNFEGDRQADLKHHGGPDKAVCVYSFDHYPYWEEWFGHPLQPGAFSENLTLGGLRETEVCIGDCFRAGRAVVQLSQPRQPCTKLAGKNGRKDLPGAIHHNGFSGFYVRVISEGLVKAGDAFEWVERHPAAVTVSFANEVMYKIRKDSDSLRRILAVAELSDAWRETLSQRL